MAGTENWEGDGCDWGVGMICILPATYRCNWNSCWYQREGILDIIGSAIEWLENGPIRCLIAYSNSSHVVRGRHCGKEVECKLKKTKNRTKWCSIITLFRFASRFFHRKSKAMHGRKVSSKLTPTKMLILKMQWAKGFGLHLSLRFFYRSKTIRTKYMRIKRSAHLNEYRELEMVSMKSCKLFVLYFIFKVGRLIILYFMPFISISRCRSVGRGHFPNFLTVSPLLTHYCFPCVSMIANLVGMHKS